jgi:CBS-domain-containing membrane protein
MMLLIIVVPALYIKLYKNYQDQEIGHMQIYETEKTRIKKNLLPRDYFQKMQGVSKCPPGISLSEILWSWIGAFLGISAVALMSYQVLEGKALTMIVGSFGASAALIYGAVGSPLAQPRNLVGGHVLSAIVGVTCFQLLQPHIWLAAALAVATAVTVMQVTRTLHPPGGATALIAVICGEGIHKLGYLYAIFPVALGAVVMLAVALLVNNISSTRRYPEYWF